MMQLLQQPPEAPSPSTFVVKLPAPPPPPLLVLLRLNVSRMRATHCSAVSLESAPKWTNTSAVATTNVCSGAPLVAAPLAACASCTDRTCKEGGKRQPEQVSRLWRVQSYL